MKIKNEKQKIIFIFFWGGGVRLGGLGRCEQRSEVFVKNKKKNVGGEGSGRGGGGGGGGLVGGGGWLGGGVRVDVNEELKFL